MAKYKTISDIDFSGKTVLLRADVDVPYTSKGEILDDMRIKACALSTIKELRAAGARICIIGHKGRPKGRVRPELSLRPVAKHLTKLLGVEVRFVVDCIGRPVEAELRNMKAGDVAVLENTRFHIDEEHNRNTFAQKLAKGFDVYVNDAFASSHRVHASITGAPKYVKERCAGRVLQSEVETLNSILTTPARPFLLVIGGAKVSSKIGALKNLVKRADQVMIGGAMANTFLAALGNRVGKSLFELDYIDVAQDVMAIAGSVGCRIILPQDVVVSKVMAENVESKVVSVDRVADDDVILDIGPKTTEVWSKLLTRAGTVFWNGPMGAAEIKPFDKGTMAIADTIINIDAFTVTGGGDTLGILRSGGKSVDGFNYVSTAGGALLETLEGKELPGLIVLGMSESDILY